MRTLVRKAGSIISSFVAVTWGYLGSLGAMCLLAAALGLGIHYVLVPGVAAPCSCYAGVRNHAGAVPPDGLVPIGQGMVNGVPHVRLEFGADGRVSSMKSVDARGQLCALPGSKVAEQLLHYDEAGRLVRKENLGASGAPAEDAAGVSQRLFERDSAGRVVRTVFRNAAGERTVPRFPGYAESRVSFDAQGRPLRVEYLDAGGTPIRNAAGEEVVVYHYGEDGSVSRSNLVGGKLAENYAGVALEELRRCGLGTCRRWKNAAGKPVNHPVIGAAELHHERSARNGVERRRFMEPDGSPRGELRACTEHLVRFNSCGQPEWECYSGSDGLPVNHAALGYAERLCQYSPAGRLEREYFWNAAGLPADMCERRHVDSHAGAYTLSLHADGSTEVQPE